MNLFPSQFSSTTWQGARAKQFSAPDDAFQQLVGDALQLSFQARAHVAATRGKDGSIDAWVDATPSPDSQFAGFSWPLIVECKYHDEDTAKTAYNIQQGWKKVKEKLSKQAQEDWPKLYAPWKQAQAYLYCISARFPNQQARDDLQKDIRDFFSTLPATQQLSIAPEQIRVWDWGDLQAWFNQNILLCDRWQGIHLPQWIDHLSLRTQFKHQGNHGQQTFQAYLLEENLPFVPPDSSEPSHPQALLATLAQDKNILLIGEGGVGKTRTLHEVGELAQAQGWRVLHLRPSEEEVDLKAAKDVLLQPASDTLVLIDYIDQLAHFDARYWEKTLIPEAHQRGIRLHLLTNARPAGASESVTHLQESSLFSSIHMARDAAYRQRVIDQIEERLCPTALALIGSSAVKEHCGTRPIIAMFIAQALEKMALAGELTAPDADIPRPNDLSGWLRKRLREAQILPKTTKAVSRWTKPELIEPELIAIAAGLAVCPFPQSELPAVLKATFETQQHPSTNITDIIATLQDDGWIELQDDGEFRTPHDAIADEVLREILTHPQNALPLVLSSAHLGRPLGRFARSLGRLSGVAALPDNEKTRVENQAAAWLHQEAAHLGQSLLLQPADTVAYALGALFDYPVWHQVAQQAWQTLITPWLSQYGKLPAARHLLHRGLKSLQDASLLPAALSWLRANGKAPAASFVLSPLLAWNAERLGEHQAEVLELALDWLQDADNATLLEAEFVLNPLLAWETQRLGERQTDVLELALDWLLHTDNATTPEAGFVLPPLLAWESQRLGEHQTDVLELVLDWLLHPDNANVLEAQFVFNPLLAWESERLGERQTDVLELALGWLQHAENATTPEAGFVLPPLLAWESKCLSTHQTEVLKLTLRWLQHAKNAETPDAGFVLPPLLKAQGLASEDRTRIANLTAKWLETFPERDDATHVLKSLLQAANQFPDAIELRDALIPAGKWLDRHPAHPERPFVLARILRMHNLPQNVWTNIANAGLALLEGSSSKPEHDFLLNGILSRLNELPNEHLQRWLKLSIQWISCANSPYNMNFLFYNCRKFLPLYKLDSIRPALIAANAANAARQDFPQFDWTRHFANDFEYRG